MDKNFIDLNYFPINAGNKNIGKNNKRKESNSNLINIIAVLSFVSVFLFLLLIVAQPPAGELITSDEYAVLLINTVDNMDLPYDIKVNLLNINDSDNFLNAVNITLDKRSKIKKNKPVTREQSAYMIDFLLKYISVNYRQAENILTHLPAYIPPNMYRRTINNITDTRDKSRVTAYFGLIYLHEHNLLELSQQPETFIPLAQRTAVYVLDKGATTREEQMLIDILNNHGAVTDSDIIRMNMKYGIIQSYAPVISFEPLYLENLPNLDGVSQQIKSEIENAFTKTTLADNSLTQAEYDYIISEYTRKYRRTLSYRKLTDEITPEKKRQIQTILNKHPEIMIDITARHEKFDEEYNIPVIIEHDKFIEICKIIHPYDSEMLNDYYTIWSISPDEEDYNFIIPSDEQIEIYILRDDVTVEEKLRLETLGFERRGKRSAVFLKINDELIYSDIDEVSSWARDSVEIMCRTNIMKGERMFNFVPAGILTREEAYEIMSSIASGMIIY